MSNANESLIRLPSNYQHIANVISDHISVIRLNYRQQILYGTFVVGVASTLLNCLEYVIGVYTSTKTKFSLRRMENFYYKYNQEFKLKFGQFSVIFGPNYNGEFRECSNNF